MAKLRIYTNESAHPGIAAGLRQRGVDAWAARDSRNLGWSDEQQLAYAVQERAAFFTHDNDFLRLAHEWQHQGKEHWGILFIRDQHWSVGEYIRRILRVVQTTTVDEMKNQIVFL